MANSDMAPPLIHVVSGVAGQPRGPVPLRRPTNGSGSDSNLRRNTQRGLCSLAAVAARANKRSIKRSVARRDNWRNHSRNLALAQETADTAIEINLQIYHELT